MKFFNNKLLFVFFIFSFFGCEKEYLEDDTKRISLSVNGETHKFKKVSVEETNFYESLYPDEKQYKVYGRNSSNDNQANDEFVIFYFVEKNNSVFLHAIQLNNINEPNGFFARDITDSDFNEKVTVSTKKTGNKVVCNFSVKFTFQNQPTKLLTDGICEFDLSKLSK